MHIVFGVARAVMFAMMARPPKRALLHTHHTANRQEQLECPTRLERTMREIPVVASGNKPDSSPHHDDEQPKSHRSDPKDDRA